MRRKVFILILIIAGLVIVSVVFLCKIGSDVHIDIPSCFFFQGRVYDKQTNRPLENVKIIFTLTGFVANPNLVQEVGESDQSGQIDLKYHFFWSIVTNPLKTLLGKDPPKTFDLLLFKEFYFGKRFSFDADDLPKKGVCFYVDLKNIYLDPDPKKQEK